VKISSRGGGRATDESGAWKLRTVEDAGANTEELQDALMSAQQQLDCLEQDVLALEFVAEHHALEDICDLDMHYNNPHLEVRHVGCSFTSWSLCLLRCNHSATTQSKLACPVKLALTAN